MQTLELILERELEHQQKAIDALMSALDGVILCQEKVQIKNDFFPSCQHT